MHPALQRLDHRPYPLPEGPWHWAQAWMDLAFIHWPIDAALLRDHIPDALAIDEYDGNAWIGVVPFHLSLRLRGTPPIPRVGIFPELNVRTYVTHDGRPGVWFFSLDARSWLAVQAARVMFALPYFHARMSIEAGDDGAFRYRSERRPGDARFVADYGPAGDVFEAEHGSLEHFLTERYCLYAERRGRLLRGDIHHLPWSLQLGDAVIEENGMLAPVGLAVPDHEPLVHFARRIEALVWPIRVVG